MRASPPQVGSVLVSARFVTPSARSTKTRISSDDGVHTGRFAMLIVSAIV